MFFFFFFPSPDELSETGVISTEEGKDTDGRQGLSFHNTQTQRFYKLIRQSVVNNVILPVILHDVTMI